MVNTTETKDNIKSIAVIGGGASGVMAALTAAKCGAKVSIIDPADKLLKKILVTGNGKCNLTNLNISKDNYRTKNTENIPELYKVIEKFDSDSLIKFFKNIGVPTREREGYVYPYSEQAQTVFNALYTAVRKNNIAVYQGSTVEAIEPHNEHFELKLSNGMSITANKIIVATGSKSGQKKSYPNDGYSIAAKFGHHIIKPLPALTALICKENFLKDLSGVRAKASINLCDNNEYGEVQFTDYGVSGIPVFQLSRYAIEQLNDSKKDKLELPLTIDFMPEIEYEELRDYITLLVENAKEGYFTSTVGGLLNNKIMTQLFKSLKIENNIKNEDIDEHHISMLAALIKESHLTVVDYKDFDFSQVTQGGVDLNEINLATMESKQLKGVYFCGEVLDVDGMCGGYNLQWAFSSGHLAGYEAAKA